MTRATRHWSDDDDARLRELDAAGLNNDELAAALGCSSRTITTHRMRLGLPRRKGGRRSAATPPAAPALLPVVAPLAGHDQLLSQLPAIFEQVCAELRERELRIQALTRALDEATDAGALVAAQLRAVDMRAILTAEIARALPTMTPAPATDTPDRDVLLDQIEQLTSERDRLGMTVLTLTNERDELAHQLASARAQQPGAPDSDLEAATRRQLLRLGIFLAVSRGKLSPERATRRLKLDDQDQLTSEMERTAASVATMITATADRRLRAVGGSGGE